MFFVLFPLTFHHFYLIFREFRRVFLAFRGAKQLNLRENKRNLRIYVEAKRRPPHLNFAPRGKIAVGELFFITLYFKK